VLVATAVTAGRLLECTEHLAVIRHFQASPQQAEVVGQAQDLLLVQMVYLVDQVAVVLVKLAIPVLAALEIHQAHPQAKEVLVAA